MATTHLHSYRSFTLIMDKLSDVLDESYAEEFEDDLAKTIDKLVACYKSDCPSDDLPIKPHGHSGSEFECPINEDAVLIFRLSTDHNGPGKLLAVHIFLRNIEFLPESSPQ